MADVSKVTFKKVKEDANGGRQWHVDAIHVTTTRNNRVYTEAELRLAARGLSYRPININHDEGRFLNYDFREPTSPYSNTTLIMDFSPEKNAVSGDLWITDPVINQKIEKGDIQTVSIEQTPYKGESCSCNAAHSCTCEQHGIVFSAIAILETSKGVQPGDPNAIIKASESAKEKMEKANLTAGEVMAVLEEQALKNGVKLPPEPKTLDEAIKNWSDNIMKSVKKEDDGDNPCEDGFKKNADGKCVKTDDDSDDNAEADYPWDQCISDQKGKGYDDETAKKICGSIKAANELKKGCNCETRKQEIDELLKLELYLLTGKIE